MMQWFDSIFPSVVQMSLKGSVTILVVLLARMALKKAPRAYSYALWGLVLIQLLVSVQFLSDYSSPISMMPTAISSGEITNQVLDDYIGSVQISHSGTEDYQTAVEAGIEPMKNQEADYVVTGADGISPPHTMQDLCVPVWMIGMSCMLLYCLGSYFRLRSRLIGAVALEPQVWMADHIESPFVMGMIVPRIYLPSDLTAPEKEYILLHENTHLDRLDYLTRPIAFLALTIHWFNPLVWLAFILSAQDMEQSCDEAVLKHLGAEIKSDYSQSLLRFTVGRRIAAMPLAFGEGNVKSRIKNILHYKPPKLWIRLTAFACFIAMAAVLLPNRPEAAGPAVPLFEIQHTDTTINRILNDYYAHYYSDHIGVISFDWYTDEDYPEFTIVGFMGDEFLGPKDTSGGFSYFAPGYAVLYNDGTQTTVMEEHFSTGLSTWEVILDRNWVNTGDNCYHVFMSKDENLKTIRTTTDVGTVTTYEVPSNPSMTVIPWGDAQASIHVEWLDGNSQVIGEEDRTWMHEPAELPLYPVYSREEAAEWLDVDAIDAVIHKTGRTSYESFAYYVNDFFPDLVMVGYTCKKLPNQDRIGYATVRQHDNGYQLTNCWDKVNDGMDLSLEMGQELSFSMSRVGSLGFILLDNPNLATVYVERTGFRFDTAPLEFSVGDGPAMIVYPRGRASGATVEFLDANGSPIRNPYKSVFTPGWAEYDFRSRPFQ